MIHNSSSDPVLIKKISLKVWSLRDEIELRIQEKIDTGEIPPEGHEEKINEIRLEYTKKILPPDNIIPLKSSEELSSEGEDEMAKAMAEAASPEEKEPEDNVVLLNKETPLANEISIKSEAPALSPEKIAKGKTILSEIGMDKMFFFSNKAFTEGQSVVIQFCIPKTFIVNADVVYCRPFNIKSRIISKNNYTHRMLIKFNFLKEGERALLRQFLQSIEPDLSVVVKKVPGEKEDSADNDFSELDDLGL